MIQKQKETDQKGHPLGEFQGEKKAKRLVSHLPSFGLMRQKLKLLEAFNQLHLGYAAGRWPWNDLKYTRKSIPNTPPPLKKHTHKKNNNKMKVWNTIKYIQIDK